MDQPKKLSGATKNRANFYKGLFKAPRNGKYRFLMSSQGAAEFDLAHNCTNKTRVNDCGEQEQYEECSAQPFNS
jgi:hypothetical protein